MSEWWDNFSNNLATDLAPLVSLFGEAPTKQYLSESLGLLDVLIFSTAPLGILTAVVSAIRVCGTPSLRAFIGRAQEGGGSAEAELCSSTSREVCELYNCGGIARVFGRPKLLEIVHDQDATNNDFYQRSKELPSAGIYSFETYCKQPGQEWHERISKKARFKSAEDGNSATSESDDEKTILSDAGQQRQRFAPNPNLSLNVGIKPRSRGWFIAAATTGILLQAAVLIWASIARYTLKLIREDSQDRYAVPLTVIGTVVLFAGIALCASLVERSTKERVFERELEPNQTNPRSRIYWVQPGTQFVGDQAFDSFAYTHPKHGLTRYTTSWKDTTPPSGIWVWVAITSTMVGFVLQFLGLRACHSSVAVAQFVLTIVMSMVRSMLRTERLAKEDIFLADRPGFYEKHELDWLALNIGQGLETNSKNGTDRPKRGWFISSARCYYPVQRTKEDTWNGLLLMRVLANNKSVLTGFRPGSEKLQANNIWHPEEWRTKIHSNTKEAQNTQGENPNRKRLGRPNDTAKVLLYRARLARLTSSWEEDNLVAVRDIARSLARAIEATAKVLYTTDVVFEKGWNDAFTIFWPVTCTLLGTGSDSSGAARPSLEYNTDDVYLSLRREIDAEGSCDGVWSADEAELEAVLGLWLWSLKDADDRKLPETPLKRILSIKQSSADGTDAKMDFGTWLGAGGFRIAETEIKPPPHPNQHRLFGWQNIPAGQTQTVKALELQGTTKSFTKMCAQEIYALFFTSILHAIEDIGGQTEVQGSRNFYLVNNNITQIQEVFRDSGLGSFEDAFTCIFPALRIQGKLPSVSGTLYTAKKTAEIYMDEKRWEEAAKLLRWALPHTKRQLTTSDDADGDIKQAESINHLRMLTLVLCECYRKALFSDDKLDFGLDGILEMLKDSDFETLKQISLVTVEGASPYTLAKTVRCYGHVALRCAQNKGKGEAVKGLEQELRNSSERCEGITDGSSRPEAIASNTSNLNVATPDKEHKRPLSQAIARGDLSSTLFLLGGKCIINEKDEQNKSALLLAAERGWCVVVKALIDCGAVLEERDNAGRSAISYATENGDTHTFDYLLGMGSFPNFADMSLRTPLSYAAEHGHLAIAKTLLADLRVEPKARDNKGRTPLSWAAGNGHEGIVQLLLLKDGVDVDSPDGKELTPLSWAAQNGHEAVVKLLVERGAAVDLVDTKNGQTLLSRAAENGHEAVVELLIEKGAVVDSVDRAGRTPLSWAAQNGHEAVVKLLVEKGAAVDSEENEYRQTPLSRAAEKGHQAVVKQLTEKGAERYTKASGNGAVLLASAVQHGYEAVVKLLIEKGAAIESSNNGYGLTPLSIAAAYGREAVAKLLVEKGAAVDSVNGSGGTPLSWAAKDGHEAVVKLLVEKGAVVDSIDIARRTPLSEAADGGHEAVVKLLVEEGAAVDSVDGFAETPLSRAAQNGHEAVVKLLIEKGAAVDSVNGSGGTSLSRAAKNGHEAMVKLLVEKGAERYTKASGDGPILLSWAARKGYKTVVELLIEKGAAVDSVDESGRTSLSWAAEKGHEAVVKLLVEKGATVDLVDKLNQTPLSWAAEKGQEAVVKLLIEKGAAVDSVNVYGQTPLSQAARNGHKAAVRQLVEKGAAVDLMDKFGRTPLSRATMNGHEVVVKLLAEKGAAVK